MTIKYINNRELLAEIQRSKATFCYFTSPIYSMYDVILTSLEDLTPEFVASTRIAKAAKLSNKTNVIDPQSIDPETIVFRLMTDSHLPLETDEKRRRKSVTTGEWVAKPNFPPFKHYIMKDEKPVEVGRSHWKNDFEDGAFCIEHGKITNRLAQMFMLLVDHYSLRGNWRGYCVDEQTEALTQRGWLGTNEINENDLILSYDSGQLKWSKIKSIFRDDNYDGKMFHLSVTGMDALVTPGHKFVTDNGLKEVEYLLETDKIILTGDPLPDGEGNYTDAFVELVGRVVTKGIDNLAHLPREIVTENKILSMQFLLSLSQTQREILINTMVNADKNYCQKAQIDAFLALCTMAGYRTFNQNNAVSFWKPSQIYSKIDEDIPTVDYKGRVWCPETEYGSFMARRNGYIYLTGNSYVDEMKCHALMHLSQVGLQFDESRSDNPFAFYTQIVKHCYTRVLNLEKRNQSVRDDLLIMSGVNPSYTRQVDNEIDQHETKNSNDDSVKAPAKRGRKPKVR